MKFGLLISIQLLIIQFLVCACLSHPFDFFYFSQQWPGSRCNTEQGCCYPTTGKPATDFMVRGLQPANRHGEKPTFCFGRPFDESKISGLLEIMQHHWPSLDCPSNDGMLYWSHKWAKYGTCSNFIQHKYFSAALDLKNKTRLLDVLTAAGIAPIGRLYSLRKIKDVIRQEVGYDPVIYCNMNENRQNQLYEILLCVHSSGLYYVRCPDFKLKSCKDMIRFPLF